MDIEENIAIAYLSIRSLRKRRKKRKPQKESVRKIFQEREEKRAFVLFHYLNYCFIFLEITFAGFTNGFLLKFFLSHFLMLFIKAFSTNLQIPESKKII